MPSKFGGESVIVFELLPMNGRCCNFFCSFLILLVKFIFLSVVRKSCLEDVVRIFNLLILRDEKWRKLYMYGGDFLFIKD